MSAHSEKKKEDIFRGENILTLKLKYKLIVKRNIIIKK